MVCRKQRQKFQANAVVVVDRDDNFPAGGADGFSLSAWNMLAPCLHEPHPESLKWKYRQDAWQRCLGRLSACDVLCFQEVDRDCVAEELTEMLAAHGFAVVHQDLKGREWGNATFFKTERLRLMWSEHRSRVLLTCFALPHGRVIGVVNVHLEAGDTKTNEEQRLSMLRSALRHVHKHSPSLVIVAGDFNCSLLHGSELINILVAEGLCRVPIKGLTFAVPGYVDTLDHIWASAQLCPCAAIGSTPGALQKIAAEGMPNQNQPSDHLPVAARFEFLDSGNACLEQISFDAPPVDCDSAVRHEWLQILDFARQAIREGQNKKKAMREQRELEKAFLEVISEEAVAFLRQWHAGAVATAKSAVAAIVLHAQHRIRARHEISAHPGTTQKQQGHEQQPHTLGSNVKKDTTAGHEQKKHHPEFKEERRTEQKGGPGNPRTHLGKDQFKTNGNKHWDPGGLLWIHWQTLVTRSLKMAA